MSITDPRLEKIAQVVGEYVCDYHGISPPVDDSRVVWLARRILDIVDEGERVGVAIREAYSDRSCSCGGRAWEVETDCKHWSAGDRASHGYAPATLILHREANDAQD